MEITTYEELTAKVTAVERGWDEHGEPLVAAAKKLAEAWTEHGDGAVAAIAAAKKIHEAITDGGAGGERFKPGTAVLAALEALMESAGNVSPAFADIEEAAERVDNTPDLDGFDDTVAEAKSATATEAAKIAEVAEETGADVRLETATA